MSTKPLDNAGMPVRDIDLTDGSDTMFVLEGIQNVGGLYERSELPFDMDLFGNNKLLEKLQTYYRQTRNSDCVNCLDLAVRGSPLDNQAVKTQISNIRNISNSLDDFLNKVNKDLGSEIYKLLPLSSTAKRIPVPPFNVKRKSFANGDKYIEHVIESLKNGTPAIASICFNRLEQKITGRYLGSDCGDHAMIAVGARTNNGKCQILLRNSHGTSWPSLSNADPGRGQQWVDLDDFLSSVKKSDGRSSYLTSINKRTPPVREVKNDVPLSSGSRYVGRTWKGQAKGKGKLYSKTGELKGEGEFDDGKQITGNTRLNFDGGNSYWGNFYLVGNTYYPHNQGEMYDERGKIIEEGTYERGRFLNGTSSRISYQNGNRYSGKVINSQPEGVGELFNSRGDLIAKGEFEAGRIKTGELFKYPVTTRQGNSIVNKLFTGPINNFSFDMQNGRME